MRSITTRCVFLFTVVALASNLFAEQQLVTMTHPVPNLEAAPPTLDKEEVADILQYGRLRYISTYAKTDRQELIMAIESYATFLTHTVAPASNSFASRFRSHEKLASRSLASQKVQMLLEKRNRFPMLPYTQYQSHITKGLIDKWDEHLALWENLLPRENWDSLANLDDVSFAEMKHDDQRRFVDRMATPQTYLVDDAKKACLTLDAPFTMDMAKACQIIDICNGANGVYFDCGAYPGVDSGYSKYGVARFRNWISETVPATEQIKLFGTTADKVDPPFIETNKKFLHKNIMMLTDELDVSMYAPGSDARQTPAQVAWVRSKEANYRRFMRELTAHGKSLYPGYVGATTYYVDDSGPHFYAMWSAYSVDNMVQQGEGHPLVLWEATYQQASRGRTENKDWKDKDLFNWNVLHESGWYPYAASDDVYARYTNTPSYKLYTEAAGPTPLADKSLHYRSEYFKATEDGTFAQQREGNLVKLRFAESWANLSSHREGAWQAEPVRREALITMNGFQHHNESLFIGARRYDRIAVWCSLQQHWARRYDTALGVSRMLLDADIEHRIINDTKVNSEKLDDLDCIVVSDVRLMTDQQIAILNRFAKEEGNSLILLGRVADRDQWDRDRTDGIARICEGVPQERIVVLGSDVYPRLSHTGSYLQKGIGDNVQPLADAVHRVFKGLTYLGETSKLVEVHPVRIDAVEGDPQLTRTIAHVLNYSVDIVDGTFRFAKPFEVSVLVPENHQIEKIAGYVPAQWRLRVDDKILDVPFEKQVIDGSTYVTFTVPQTELYRMFVIESRANPKAAMK